MLLTPLNRDNNSNAAVISTSSKKTTKEAQESACFQEYHDALKLQRDGDLNGAKALYQHLLQSSFLSIEEGSGGSASTTAAKLKYSICRNLASIFKDQGDLSVAIDTYLKATHIDDSDITTWLQLSKVAQLQGNLLIARMALEKAIECSPDHWQSLDLLCKVLFTIQDNPACLSKCSTALERNPFYIRGLIYVNHILHEDGNTLWIRQFEDLKKYSSNYHEAVSSSHADECLEEAKSLREKWCQHCKDEEKTLMPTWKPVNPQKDLFDINWLSLGRWLLFAWDYYRDLVWAGKNSWCSKLEFPNIDAVRPIVLKYASPTHPSSSISDAVKPSPTNVGEGIPKLSPQKRKASEAVPASDQNVTPKRRSSRAAKAKKHDIPPCYFDMLKKYIPERFGMSQLESLQSLDLSPLRKKPNMGSIGKRSSAALLSPTKVLSTDTSDSLRQFIANHINNRGVVSVVFDFLKHLAVHYDWVWPFPLGGVFVELYQKVEQHLAQPSPLCNQLEPNELEHLKDFVRVSLTYCELLVDSQCKATVGKKKGTDKTSQHPASPALPLVDGLIPLILFSVSKFEGKEKDHILFRVIWLLAQVKMTRNDPVAATGHVLELCQLLEGYKGSDNVVIYLCNLHHDPYISLAHAKDRVNSLERSLSLEKINSLYQNGSYSEVVDHLLPVFDQESGSYTEFLIGSTQLVGNQRQQRTSSLYLLLSSLLKLNRIEECLCCAVLAVEELLTHSNTNSDLWTSSVYSTFEMVNKCILEESKLLSKPSQQNVVKVLIVQICRVLNIMFDVDTPLVHTLPVCLAWKIFYHIVKGEEKDDEEDNNDDIKRENMVKESSGNVTAPAASSDVADGVTSSVSAFQGNSAPSKDTSNEDAHVAQAAANTPTTPDIRARSSSSSSELLSPMHDHTYALPSPLITPTMMAAIDSHSISHKGYTCLSRIGQISVPPQQPAENNSLKKSVEFLKEAHTHLGTLGWCCWDNGCLLLLSIQVLRKELNRLTAFSPKHRDILLRELEQCYYCLYGHPKKASRAKARGLKEHGAIPVELTWEAALLLMEYFHPTSLPSVEDNKYGWGGLSGLCADLLALYKRIVDIVPKKLGQVINCDDIQAFIDGNSTQLPQPRPAHPHSTLIAELYYILADDALKSNDTNKAMKYYLLDLSYCPERFDSWAGLSLAKSRKIIDKIQQCDAKSGAEKFIQKHAYGVLRCFERAVALNNKNCFVIEKYGFFVYTLQAYASQVTKQKSMYASEELHSWAKDLRQKTLLLSKNCFTQALSLAGTKSAQPWLYQYMLGKTYYKLEMPVNICLESLCNALQTLDREGAIYPRNVDLTTKYFAKEGIEVCYQFYSVLLKCMIAGKGNEISSKVLSDMKELPLSILICSEATTFADNVIPPLRDKAIQSKEGGGVVASKLTPIESSTTVIMDALLMDTFLPSQEDSITVIPETPEGSQKRKQEEEQEKQQQDQQQQEQPLSGTKAPVESTSQASIESTSQTSVESTSQAQAVDCLGTMTLETLDIPSYIDRQMLHHSICVLVSLLLRFPMYFKPLYRLAWVFYKLKAFKLAKMCLLGPLPTMFQQGKILPLFVLKLNVFTNLWQIPGEELNRPGSFSTHARTNLQLLVSVLLKLDDLTSLTSLALNLRNKPDPSKQYLRDVERQAITKALVVLCVEMLKKQAGELRGDSTNADELFAKGASVKLLASKLDVGSKELSKEVAVVLLDLASKATPS